MINYMLIAGRGRVAQGGGAGQKFFDLPYRVWLAGRGDESNANPSCVVYKAN